MSAASRAREAGDPEVQREARARMIRAVADIQALVGGKAPAEFFSEGLDARTVRKACELDMIRLASDVEESGLESRLPPRIRRGLVRIRNIAAHGYSAMDEASLWVSLNDLQPVMDVARLDATPQP